MCGVFSRVAAHCTDPDGLGGGYSCPHGENADLTLCDGVPVYQRQDHFAPNRGPVLYRARQRYSQSARWVVGTSDRLYDCAPSYSYAGMASRDHDQQEDTWSDPSGRPPSYYYPPDAATYGWSDPDGYQGLHIVAGDGGGGGR